jgi:hypothetical protein
VCVLVCMAAARAFNVSRALGLAQTHSLVVTINVQ